MSNSNASKTQARPNADWRLCFLAIFVCLWTIVLPAHAAVQITEFLASNGETSLDDDGDSSDWIEIYNSGDTAVNLDGWYLTDNPNELDLWRFPAIELQAREFLLVWASGKDRRDPAAPLHTNFKLSATGEYLAIIGPDGNTPAFEFAPDFPPQRRDYSYGLAQDVQENILLPEGSDASFFLPQNDLLGTQWIEPDFDDSSWASGPAGIGYESAVPGFGFRLYQANIVVSSLDLAIQVANSPSLQTSTHVGNIATINFVNNSGSTNFGDDLPFPGTSMAEDADNLVLEAMGTIHIPTAGAWTFGVNSDDGFMLEIGPHEMSYPSPRSAADSLETFQINEPGDYPLYLLYYEQGGGASVEVFAAEGAYAMFDPAQFRLIGDTAAGGLGIFSPVISQEGQDFEVGFGSAIGTDILDSMLGSATSAYLRFPFQVDSALAIQSLDLKMQYDDGFVAYLNGTEVARSNAPTPPAWNSTALQPRPNELGVVPEVFSLSGRLDLLRPGLNVLAVHGLNITADDVDFLVHPQLVEYEAASSTAVFFATPTPGDYNGEGFSGFVADPEFSHDHGFYDAPFSLTLRTDTPGATIWYTLDGSTPKAQTSTQFSTPIPIAGTSVVRAIAVLDGYEPSHVKTASYLFLDDIVQQSPTGAAPEGWPTSWGNNVVNYGMDPDIVNHPVYGPTIRDDLKSIPTISLVTDLANLFDGRIGIYANPGQDGRTWERPVSAELIFPDGSDSGFQINAGIRIRGGYSRSTNNPKHAFRLFFRSEYGETKLNYPLFGDEGTDIFDAIDLRTFQNYSWSFEGDARGIFIRDQLNRDMQLAMGHQGERGNYYHLYINGQYWGLFNTCERPEASYAETYFGGEKENYDVVKVDAGGYNIYATDGTLVAWRELWNLCEAGLGTDAAFQRVQGNNPDGSRNPDYPVYLDLENLIDYMLVIYFGGNLDAPISNFSSNVNPNNWYGIRDRTGDIGFRFFVHDAEHTLLDVNQNRLGPYPAGNIFYKSNPQRIFQQLMAHPEFNLMVADRIHKHMFNGGVLSVEGATALLDKRYNEIYAAVVGESARWGDSKTSTPLNRDQHWLIEMNRVRNSYLTQRTGIVLNQFKSRGLYPSVNAPVMNIQGGNIEPGTMLTLSASEGTIFYTIDGTDPRLPGGALSPAARRYAAPVAIHENLTLKARVRSGTTWSALNEADFLIIQTFTELAITEIMYHPLDDLEDDTDGNEFEFLELKNLADVELDLSGVHFTEGIAFRFPNGTRLAPGEFVVLTTNPDAFSARYPGVPVDGVYTGRLNNAGERITLVHAVGTNIATVKYNDNTPWPLAADGEGFSIVRRNPTLIDEDIDSPTAWRASAEIHGSPGRDDPSPIGMQVLINEVMARPMTGGVDAIELFNPDPLPADIGGWFLTDDRNDPRKFRIPLGTLVPAGGYLVLDETMFNATPGGFGYFGLSAMGEEVFLFSGDTVGSLTGYSHGFTFEASDLGTTWGRHILSTGSEDITQLATPTLGADNSLPKVGPVVISEIYFHPKQGTVEYVELQNITDQPVPLFDAQDPTNTWSLNGVGFDFPPDTILPPHGLALVVATTPEAFLADHTGIPEDVLIFGPYAGTLQDNGELLVLQKPWDGTIEPGETAPQIPVDSVRYRVSSPWPIGADGTGLSLERLVPADYGNDPANWRVSPGLPSPGLDNLGNRPPLVNAGPDQEHNAIAFPLSTMVAGQSTDDGQPGGPITYAWSMVSGPGPVTFADRTQAETEIFLPGAGTFVLRLTASDGDLQGSDTLTIEVGRPSGELTFFPAGSVWKYLDTGVAAPNAWTTIDFDDQAWKSGPAQLGYGDGDEQTVLGYGPNAQDKYRTYYFRRSFQVVDAVSVSELAISLLRDDGAIVYLNGQEVVRSNMPDGIVDHTTFSAGIVGGEEEYTYYLTSIDPSLLVEGENVIAVELHQCNASSSDLGFDLELTGAAFPVNQAPTLEIGPNQETELGTPLPLVAAYTDDGLPLPPGAPSFSWSKLSGPGIVEFSPSDSPATIIGFSQPGTYLLRLTVNDGEYSVSDQVQVTVTSTDPFTQWMLTHFSSEELADPDLGGSDADPDGDGFTNREEFLANTNPRDPNSRLEFFEIELESASETALALRFEAAPDRSYSILYTEDLAGGVWNVLQSIPAEPEARLVTIHDPDAIQGVTRFYRIVTPMRP
ncbi:MAG: lamin tail domain-containing protein [Verrucomicrobiota bacterium]|nr:lamin tail domain-containing protein [Verrucomicrobiota bacterium]